MPRGLGQLTNLQTLSLFRFPIDSAPEDIGQLSELITLNSLRGELEILGFRHGEDVALLDYKGANLKEKQHLQVLTLKCWSRENVNARDENMAFEDWVPPPNLKKLDIGSYWSVKLSEGFSTLTNLVELLISGCRKLKYLPPLSRLPSLKSLYLWDLEEIEYVSDCSDNNELSSFSSSAFFPSLEQIVINYCPNLKGWWRRSDSYNVDVNTTDHALLLFPRLSELIIEQCPMLTSLPMFPHLEEKLVLENASWKPVQQTITNASSSSASSTPIAFSSPPLSKLKTIFLSGIHDLETLPVQNLVSLQHLTIADCPMLDLGNDEHGMQWKGLKSLISLGFTGMPKLVSLPLGLQHVTSLRRLQISDCSSLLAIPEWICNWASLEEFTISKCSGLTSLPEAMSRLTSLKTLKIYDCPILLRRCEQERGEDWPKIAHIPKLDFRLPYLG